MLVVTTAVITCLANMVEARVAHQNMILLGIKLLPVAVVPLTMLT